MRVGLLLASSTGGVGAHVRALTAGLVEAGHVPAHVGVHPVGPDDHIARHTPAIGEHDERTAAGELDAGALGAEADAAG